MLGLEICKQLPSRRSMPAAAARRPDFALNSHAKFAPLTSLALPSSPAMDAATERDERSRRLQRLCAALLGTYGTILACAAVPESDTASSVDGARLTAASQSLVASVDGLLALVRELKLDLLVSSTTSADTTRCGCRQ